jgi:phosphinothricin acetyltransferase
MIPRSIEQDVSETFDPLVSNPFQLFPADLPHIPAITAIYAEAVVHGTASWELDSPDAAEMARRMADIQARGYPYLVATAGDEVVGYAYASAYRPRLGYRFTVEDSVYVAPGWQGRGLGRLLLAALIDATTAQGYRQMIAVIGDSENAASIALHAGLGFTHAGLLRSIGFKHGRWLDGVLMQRGLGEGDATLPGESE